MIKGLLSTKQQNLFDYLNGRRYHYTKRCLNENQNSDAYQDKEWCFSWKLYVGKKEVVEYEFKKFLEVGDLFVFDPIKAHELLSLAEDMPYPFLCLQWEIRKENAEKIIPLIVERIVRLNAKKYLKRKNSSQR